MPVYRVDVSHIYVTSYYVEAPNPEDAEVIVYETRCSRPAQGLLSVDPPYYAHDLDAYHTEEEYDAAQDEALLAETSYPEPLHTYEKRPT